MLVFLSFLDALEGLESSGRLVGRNSSYFCPNPMSWYRVMTKKQKNNDQKSNDDFNMSVKGYLQKHEICLHKTSCYRRPRSSLVFVEQIRILTVGFIVYRWRLPLFVLITCFVFDSECLNVIRVVGNNVSDLAGACTENIIDDVSSFIQLKFDKLRDTTASGVDFASADSSASVRKRDKETAGQLATKDIPLWDLIDDTSSVMNKAKRSAVRVGRKLVSTAKKMIGRSPTSRSDSLNGMRSFTTDALNGMRSSELLRRSGLLLFYNGTPSTNRIRSLVPTNATMRSVSEKPPATIQHEMKLPESTSEKSPDSNEHGNRVEETGGVATSYEPDTKAQGGVR